MREFNIYCSTFIVPVIMLTRARGFLVSENKNRSKEINGIYSVAYEFEKSYLYSKYSYMFTRCIEYHVDNW